MKLTVTTLGRMQLQCDGKPVTGFLSQKKAEALIVYLLCNPGAHARQSLATLFWGDYPEDRALNNLSVLLSSVRKQLHQFLITTRQTIAINENADCDSDIRRFEAAILAGEKAWPTDRARAITHWMTAVEQYQGEFLRNFYVPDSPDFETWARIERERLRQLAVVTYDQIVDYHLQQGQLSPGITHANHSLQLDPLNEAAHRRLMRLLAHNGQRVQALAQYERCRQILADEVAVEPDPKTVLLAEAIRTGHFEKEISSQENERARGQEDKQQSGVAEVDTNGSTSAFSDFTPSSKLDPYTILSRLEPLPDQQLFGIDTASNAIQTLIQRMDRPWLIALDGIGGIGKTTLANRLVRRFLDVERFADIGWVSAKQEEFLPDVGIQSTGRPALDVETLTDSLLEQLSADFSYTMSSRDKRNKLLRLLKEIPHLIVIDNLETVADYQALIPYLRQLVNPTKIVITTRFTLKQYADIFCYSLAELNQTDTLAFLRYEAATRGMIALEQGTDEQLDRIYQVVGGNPLALKLVVGQINFLPLAQVLANLQQAQGERIDALYTYIYWQAWQMLDDSARRLFLAMPTVHNGTFAQLAIAAMLEQNILQSALKRLVDLSLVQVAGDLDEPRYHLHRLTETFLMNEVLKWGSG